MIPTPLNAVAEASQEYWHVPHHRPASAVVAGNQDEPGEASEITVRWNPKPAIYV
jgi:hypothetical protein